MFFFFVYIIVTATPDQIDKAKTFIKKLNFPFSSENFENPVLQTHYRTLEALALDKDLPDDVVDHTGEVVWKVVGCHQIGITLN